jgi:aspartate/methionine/tyrosine aminotransferase
MRFSNRADIHPRLGLNALSLELDRRRRAGRTHLDLTVSNPTRASLPFAGGAVLGALARPSALEYDPMPFGLPVAREAVAALWASRGIAVDPSRIALTASTSEAYAYLFKLLCDPGDSVLVPSPSYPLLEFLTRYEGVAVVPYRLRYDGAWHVDFDSIVRARTERTRAIVVVSPNNPTGSYVKRDELARLAELGLPIVSDEVFGAYPFATDARRPVSALEAEGAVVFALDGLSKLVALPQLKLAWITASGPAEPVSAAFERLELVCDAFLSPSTPVQQALPSLLESGRVVRDAIRARLARNLDALARRLADTPLTVMTVEGGWYAPVRFPAVLDEEAWVLGLLEERDVLVQPGFFYDFEVEPVVVVSLLTEEETFQAGVQAMAEYAARS